MQLNLAEFDMKGPRGHVGELMYNCQDEYLGNLKT